MEFNPDVLKLHGAILSLGNRGLLNNSDSTETIEVLKDIFQNASSSAKCQMIFLMILNSDLSILTHLENDESICLFTKILPLIEKDVLIKFIFELNLQTYLYDIITNCHSAFTCEIISAFLKHFKNSNFFEKRYGISQLYQLWTALFLKIHKIHINVHKDKNVGAFMPYFEEFCDLIESGLIVSLKSNINDENLYSGTHLYHFFNSILFFLETVNYNNNNYKIEQNKFYDFTFNFENYAENDIEKPSFVSISRVFNSLQKIMDYFTVDFWESLCDKFLEFDLKISLQKLIGQIIYQICEEGNILDFELSLNIPTTSLQLLSKYKIKPKSETEILSEENISVIMKNVDEGEEKKKWLKALLLHYDFNYTLVIDCLMRNLNLADHDDITFLLESTFAHLKNKENESNLNKLKNFFFQVFKHNYSDADNSLWFKKTLDLRRALLKTDTFDVEIIEIFNKLDRYFNNKHSDVQKEIVSCCMQSPEETLFKICQTALYSSNSKQVSLYCSVLSDLDYVCNIKSFKSDEMKLIEEIILDIIQSNQSAQSKECTFLSFLTELFKKNFFGFKFFENILELIILNLEKYDLKKAIFLLEIVESCRPYNFFNFNKPAFLVFMCQILPLLSWKPETFTSSQPKKLCHHIIKDIINEFTNADTEIELEWARMEILKFEEIHQSYFCDLWFKFNKCWSGSGSFMSALLALLHSSENVESVLTNQKKNFNLEKPSGDFKNFLISNVEALLPQLYDEYQWRRLDQILSIILYKYWKVEEEISENVNILEIFSSSVYLLAIKLNENSNIYNCFEFCILNFVNLRFFDGMPKDNFDDVIDFVEKLTFSVQVVERDEFRETCSYFIILIIFKLVEEICEEKIHLYEMKIKTLVKILNVNFFEEIVNRMSIKMSKIVEP